MHRCSSRDQQTVYIDRDVHNDGVDLKTMDKIVTWVIFINSFCTSMVYTLGHNYSQLVYEYGVLKQTL